MADYRVIDAEQLESDLTVVADAIREKGGTSEQLAFPNGMIEAVRAIQSGSGGNLAIKSGKVVVNGGYNFSVAHGCGKLPKWVFIEAPNDEEPVLNRITFAFWQDNYLSFTVRGSTTSLFSAMQMQKAENIAPSENENAVMVDEENIFMRTTQTLMATTFTWYAIYEGEQSNTDWFQYASSIQGMFSAVTFPENTEIELNVPNVKNLGGTFQNSLNVKKVEIKGNVNGDAVRLNSCFWGASNLETIDFSEFKCTFSDMGTAFRGCPSLKYIYGEFDCTSTTTLGGFLMLSSAVEYIRFKKETIFVELDLSAQPKLTDATIQNIIDGLADLTGQTAQIIKFHATVKAKLTEEQIATITSKNWTLA